MTEPHLYLALIVGALTLGILVLGGLIVEWEISDRRVRRQLATDLAASRAEQQQRRAASEARQAARNRRQAEMSIERVDTAEIPIAGAGGRHAERTCNG